MRSRLAFVIALVAPAGAQAQPSPPPAQPAPAQPAPAQPAPAQPQPSPDSAAMPEEVIVVTGLRLPRPARDVPTALTVIDREQLQRSPHTLADDLVRTVPDVGTFRRSSSAIADPT